MKRRAVLVASAAGLLAGSPPVLRWLGGAAPTAGTAPVAGTALPAAAARDELCVVAPLVPWDPASGIAIHAPRPVPDDARCPVCGMYPARFPDQAAQAIFDDGDAQFFDSPLDLHRYLREVGRHARGRTADAIAARWVRTSDDGGWHDAARVVYVEGGAWRGAMGPGGLRAFADADRARRHVAERGGRVLAAEALTAPVLAALARPGEGGAGDAHRH